MTQAQTPHAAAGAGDDEAAEGRVYTVSGEDWDEVVSAALQSEDFQAASDRGQKTFLNLKTKGLFHRKPFDPQGFAIMVPVVTVKRDMHPILLNS